MKQVSGLLTQEQLFKLEKLTGVPFHDTTIKQYEQASTIVEGLGTLIDLCGDDPNRDGLQETPFRVLKAFLEYTEGYREDPSAHLMKTFDVDHDDLIVVKDIEFYSMCEHHFAPFFGVAHIAYIPNNKITGLSKFARVVDGYAKRFQVQERLTNEIKDAIIKVLDPVAAMVVVEAKHMCMCGRGVKKSGTKTVTSSVSTFFRDNPAARAEVLSLIKE